MYGTGTVTELTQIYILLPLIPSMVPGAVKMMIWAEGRQNRAASQHCLQEIFQNMGFYPSPSALILQVDAPRDNYEPFCKHMDGQF